MRMISGLFIPYQLVLLVFRTNSQAIGLSSSSAMQKFDENAISLVSLSISIETGEQIYREEAQILRFLIFLSTNNSK